MLPRPPLATPPRSGPSMAGRLLAIIVGLLVLALAVLFGPTIWTLNKALVRTIQDSQRLIAGAIIVLLLAALASVPALLFVNVARQWRKAQQAAIFKAPNGMPIHVADVRGPTRRNKAGGLAASLLQQSLVDHAAQLLAEASREYPQLHSYHKVVQHDAPPPPPQIDAAPPIALSSESEWLAWTDRAPHLMVAGRTDSGKTTTVEAVLARRITAGDLVLVIDPHYQAGKWLGAQAVGGGRDYAACYQAFDNIRALLDKRYASFNAGTRTEDYKRVTIVVDEVPAIITHAQMTSKALYERWLLFANGLGSEARKVRISIILLTQSPLVRDIGISSAMRENFTRIALGDTAMDLLREDPDPARKQALLELLRDRPYAAAMEYRNSWYALRNDDIPDLARTSGSAPRAPSLLLAPPAPTGGTPPPVPPAAPAIPPTTPIAPPVLRAAPPTVKITLAEQIVDLLRFTPDWLDSEEIAERLRAEPGTIMNALTKLSKAKTIQQRRSQRDRKRLEYSADPISISA